MALFGRSSDMAVDETFIRLLAKLEDPVPPDAHSSSIDKERALAKLKKFSHQDFGYDVKLWREWLENNDLVPKTNIPAEALRVLERDFPPGYILYERDRQWALHMLRIWTGQDFGEAADKWREWLERKDMVRTK
jgi:hypothetical protein